MTNRLTRIFVAFSLLFAAATLAACTTSAPVLGESPLTVLGTITSFSHGELVEAKIVLNRGKHSVERTVPLLQNEFTKTLQLPLGQWELFVLLIDAEGKVQFQSSPQQVEIMPHKASLIELVLRPADSEVTLNIDLEGYLFKTLALRSRIHFDDHIYEIIRADASEPFEKVLMIEPGSYEFKIELYTDSFRIGDRLGPGVWEIITIPPNESLEIVWSPADMELEIWGRVESILPAPDGLVITPVDGALEVSWDPVYDQEVNGYFLLAQTNPLERFQLLTTKPQQETSFLYQLEENQPEGEILFIAVAVSTSGLVGYYSQPCSWYTKAQG